MQERPALLARLTSMDSLMPLSTSRRCLRKISTRSERSSSRVSAPCRPSGFLRRNATSVRSMRRSHSARTPSSRAPRSWKQLGPRQKLNKIRWFAMSQPRCRTCLTTAQSVRLKLTSCSANNSRSRTSRRRSNSCVLSLRKRSVPSSKRRWTTRSTRSSRTSSSPS